MNERKILVANIFLALTRCFLMITYGTNVIIITALIFTLMVEVDIKYHWKTSSGVYEPDTCVYALSKHLNIFNNLFEDHKRPTQPFFQIRSILLHSQFNTGKTIRELINDVRPYSSNSESAIYEYWANLKKWLDLNWCIMRIILVDYDGIKSKI